MQVTRCDGCGKDNLPDDGYVRLVCSRYGNILLTKDLCIVCYKQLEFWLEDPKESPTNG